MQVIGYKKELVKQEASPILFGEREGAWQRESL